METVSEAQELIGGKVVFLECEDKPKEQETIKCQLNAKYKGKSKLLTPNDYHSYVIILWYERRIFMSKVKTIIKYKRIWIFFLLPFSLVLYRLTKQFPTIAEYIFARGIYKLIATIISFITGLLPFSVAELLVIGLPILIVICMVLFIRQMISQKERRNEVALKGILNLICCISILFFIYTILCGINYNRYSITYYTNLEVRDSSVDELYQLCKGLARQANDLRAEINEVDENGALRSTVSNRKLARKSQQAYKKLGKEYGVFKVLATKPKPIILSHLLSYTEITGIYFPFTVEANVNVDISDFMIPVTMCHELAHLYGFMREDEANYIAYLACMASDDVEFMYSGVMLSLINAMNQLYDYNIELYSEIRNTYSREIRMDLSANNEYWSQFENSVVSTISNQVNDAYLKANNQTDGTNSYGRMVDLLLAQQRKYKEETFNN